MNNKFIKISLLTTALLASTVSINANAGGNHNTLSSSITNALQSAYYTGNEYVIKSVKNQLKIENPALSADINSYSKTLKKHKCSKKKKCVKHSHKAAQNIPTIIVTEAKKEEKNWKGSLEGGLAVATGNTETEKLNFAGKLTNNFGKWENILTAKANSSKENDVRNSEEYRVNDQVRYNLTDLDYVFGEFEYINDRFSGYDSRTSELLGYGRKIINEDDMKLSAEASIGARQSKLTTGVKEDTLLGKLAGKFEWDINEFVTFNQNLSVAIGEDSTITNSETALKTKLSDQLYLKAGFDVENISEVPAGTEDTDTVTKVTVGYDF